MRSKLMIISGIALALNLCSITSKAQTEEVTTEETTTETAVKAKKPFAIGVLLGTAGVGVEVRKAVTDKITLRLGMSHLGGSFTRVEQMGNVTVNGFYKGKATNVHLLADYNIDLTPTFSFRGTAGLALFTQAKVEAHLTPVGSYTYGDIELNDGSMGDARLTADWKGIAPYVGIGFGKSIPVNRIGVGLDLGTYYFTKNAEVDMKTSGYLQGNEKQVDQIESNLKSYSWLPVIQLSVSYKL